MMKLKKLKKKQQKKKKEMNDDGIIELKAYIEKEIQNIKNIFKYNTGDTDDQIITITENAINKLKELTTIPEEIKKKT